MAKHPPSGPAPTYDEEARLLSEGYSFVAGLDEAGRGPLAGPVAAGVAVLPPNPTGHWVGLVRDSKQLTPAQREDALSHMREAALTLEVGTASSDEIDEIGIVGATRLAMRRALDRLSFQADFLLLDAFPLPGEYTPQKAIVRGDSLCLSIAAASIAAKVHRDQIMREADETYPGYGFASNKGYSTPEHIRNLARLGPCAIHRYSYAPVRDVVRGDALFYPPLPVSRAAASRWAGSPEEATAGRAYDR